MKRIEYHEGQKFPRTKLTFLEEVERINPKSRRALFLCDCGNKTEADISWVRHLNTISCGCFRQEVVSAKNIKHGQATRKDPSGSYRSWQAMHQRVKVNPTYSHVTIDPDWESFEMFYLDMGDRPEGCSIERVDNLGPYSRSNCVWADKHTQSQNTRNCQYVCIDGQTKTISEWCKDKGIGYHLVKQRRRRGMTLEEAITTPVDKSKRRVKRG